MLGIVFKEFRSYLTSRSGADAWRQAVADAGLADRAWLTTDQYPDAELVALLEAVSERTGRPVAKVLEDFGQHVVPALLSVYGAFVKPEWDLFDLLEHTEDTIHRAVRLSDAKAQPPALHVERVGPGEVRISYRSPRKLCPFARGIVRGAAAHFDTAVRLAEPTCMNRGDAACRIEVAAA
jgi:predicted hydrocarbon binding protein